MGIVSGEFEFTSNLAVKKGVPLDNRNLVQYLSDLTDSQVWDGVYPYNGMFVVVEETGDAYILLDKNNISNISSWKKLGSDGSGTGSIEWIEWD